VGIAIDPARVSARAVCIKLMEAGVLSKETHETVVRLAPPLIIKKEEIDEAVEIINKVLLSF
jgi:ornithine--oxo-acid transaminase